jgi:peptidoglycan/xylan/chitin deacetylase (PgdA/CDA1 family)
MRAIIMYHSIDPSGSPISVDRGTFRAHVAWLARGPVRVLPVAELAGAGVEEDAVAITFDDGFANLETEAAPLLADHGLPATVYVVSGAVGGTNAWGGRDAPGIPTLPLLDWDGLGRVRERGMEVGAHTRTHRRLPALSPAELEDEVAGGGEAIAEATGTRPATFAYPYGAYDPASAGLVASRYAWGVTTDLRPLERSEDPALLPRLDAWYFRQPGRLEAWGSARFRWRLRARGAARRVRETFRPAGGRA